MKHLVSTTRAVCHLLALVLLAGTTTLRADPAAECRQEVQDYSIPPEQAADYIDGCILSRGGMLDPVAGEEAVPALDAGVMAPDGTDPMPDTGQAEEAGVLPGGVDGAY